MKIRVLVDTYQHQGLYKGSEHDALWDEGTKTYNFVNYGKLWTLGPLQAVEVGLLKEDEFPSPNEKLLDVINTDLKQDSVLDIQHGGSHYKDKKIQPIEYITANNLDFCQGNIVKYVTRHKDKNGAEDIRKVIHYAQFILKFEYGEEI